MLYFLGYFISFVVGFSIINWLTEKKPLPPILKIIFGLGLGLGLSGQLAFYHLILLNAFIPFFIIFIHLIILGFLLYKKRLAFPGIKDLMSCCHPWWFILSMFLLLGALYLKASLYPYGGWDAWGIWNLKARFIFLGGNHWRQMFDQALFFTNYHYPFLLPLINSWVWSFGKTAPYIIPLITSVIFAFLVPLLLSSSLHITTKNPFTLLSGILLGALPFYTLLAISQYSDILIAFYFLCIFVCFHLALQHKTTSFLTLCGLFTGLLGFIKDEGLFSAILIAFLLIITVYTSKSFENRRTYILKFVMGFIVTFTTAIIFYLLLRPENPRFINGLASTSNPATFIRAQYIALSYLAELINSHWHYLWLGIIGYTLVNLKKIKNDTTSRFIFQFLVIYICIITANYFINTHYEIKFWVSTSLHRILLTLLPISLFMLFKQLPLLTKIK